MWKTWRNMENASLHGSNWKNITTIQASGDLMVKQLWQQNAVPHANNLSQDLGVSENIHWILWIEGFQKLLLISLNLYLQDPNLHFTDKE